MRDAEACIAEGRLFHARVVTTDNVCRTRGKVRVEMACMT